MNKHNESKNYFTLPKSGTRLIDWYLERSESSPVFLEVGTTEENFQQEAARDLLWSLESAGTSSGVYFLRTVEPKKLKMHFKYFKCLART